MKNTILILLSFLLINSIELRAQKFQNIKSDNTYIYNNLEDTIFLTKIHDFSLGCFCNKLEVTDSIQINGKGAKEVLIYRKCQKGIDRHGGTYDISEKIKISKYEIWDLDNKICLFESVHEYASKFSRFDAHKYHNFHRGTESYSYDISFQADGKIIIDNLKTKTDVLERKYETTGKKRKKVMKEIFVPYHYVVPADKQTGTYVFMNGKYILQ